MTEPKKSTGKKSTKRGRPRGSRTQDLDSVAADPSRCAKCGSTEREPYSNRREIPCSGLDEAGKPYNLVVLRRTRCTKCGQVRIDRSRHLRAA